MKNSLLKIVPNRSIFKKKITFSLIVFAIISTFSFIAASNNPKTKLIIMTPQETGIKTIVFDLGDVIFTTSKLTYISIILPTILYNPMILYWLTQIDPKTAYFELLKTIPAESAQPIYNKGKQLPSILADWMSGLKTPEELKKIIEQSLEKTNHATSVKNLFTAITNLMLIPENLAASQNIVIPMANLLKKFKQAGYQICILSNWDAHTFKLVKQRHQKLFDLCDQIVISGEEKLSKPDPKFFQKLIERAQINPFECLFIDDEPYNIASAAQLGFKTIQHMDAVTTNKELISNGIVRLCQTV